MAVSQLHKQTLSHSQQNGAPITFQCATQKFMTLSVTKAESTAEVMVSQDMMYAYCILLSLGLKVKTLMILEMDNKSAVDLANNCSVGRRTRLVDVRNHFLHELKDERLLLIKHVNHEDNNTDIFMKNVTTAIFEKHIPSYVEHDEYMTQSSKP